MANDPSLVFSRTQAVWTWDATLGLDISGKNHSFTTLNAPGPGALNGISAGVFAGGNFARLANPDFLALNELSIEFLIQPSDAVTTGFVIRAGHPTTFNDFGFGFRLFAGNRWSALKRGNFGSETPGNVMQISNVNTSDPFIADGRLYHVVVVFASGFNTRIYINGAEILGIGHINQRILPDPPVTIGTGPLTGPIPILANYELAIGDPSIATAGFTGTLGRVIAYPYRIIEPQPAASYRLQVDGPVTPTLKGLAYNLGAAAAAGAANHGPVAVPDTFGPILAGSALLIPIATRSFDADGNTLTALAPAAPAQGSSRIVSNQLEYTPTIGTGGGPNHTVPQRVRDPSLVESIGIVRVEVTSPTQATGRPKFPAEPVGTPTVVSTEAQLRTAYTNAVAGNHIVLANGTYTGNFIFDRTFDPDRPVVIRSQNTNQAIFANKLFFNNGSGHFLHEVRTTYQGNSSTDGAIIGGNYLTVTRCWINSRQGIVLPAFTNPNDDGSDERVVHHVWIGWNRFTHIGANFNESASIMIYKNDARAQGSDPEEFHHIYIYRNYFDEQGPQSLDSEGVREPFYHIYIGNSKVQDGIYRDTAGNDTPLIPDDGDTPRFAEFYIEENYMTSTSTRVRFLYLKHGITSASRNHCSKDTSAGNNIYGQRTGRGTRWWGNRLAGGGWECQGGGTSDLFTDYRRNIGGSCDVCPGTKNANNAALHVAGDWALFYANNFELRVGIKASPILTDAQGGRVDNVRIYGHLGALNTPFPTAEVNVPTITVAANPPAGSGITDPPVVTDDEGRLITNATGTVIATFGGAHTGLETGDQSQAP